MMLDKTDHWLWIIYYLKYKDIHKENVYEIKIVLRTLTFFSSIIDTLQMYELDLLYCKLYVS